MADIAREAVASLAAVELGEDPAPERLIVAVVEEVDGLRGPTDLLERFGERGEMAGVAAQRADQLAGGGVALQQAAGDAEQVVVVCLDQSGVDLVAGDLVKRLVVGSVDAPEAGGAGVGQPRAVAVVEEAEEAEDDVGVTVSVVI